MAKKVDQQALDKIMRLFKQSLKAIALELDIEPDEVTRAHFRKYNEQPISDWDVKLAGGFTLMKKVLFRPEDENLESRYGARAMNRHVNKLEKHYGETSFFEGEITATLVETLQAMTLPIHRAVPMSKKAKKITRTIVAQISDTHFGANIDIREMHGINEFNWTVAARRLALYMLQIVNYKPYRRKETELLLQLNGDILAGLIHNQEWFVDLLNTQYTGALVLLTQAISYVAMHFSKVRVVCTPGNHGRNVAKAEKGRATTQKFDSFENMLYESLKVIFEQKHKNVEFDIPKAPFVITKVHKHYVLQTHGDTVINVGNPGNTINMKAINNQINQIDASDVVPDGKKISVVSVGHVHTATIQVMSSGCTLVINGCLSGTDPFAQSIGIFSNNPTQVLFESTDKHAVGDIRIITLSEADKNAELDKIISPYQPNK